MKYFARNANAALCKILNVISEGEFKKYTVAFDSNLLDLNMENGRIVLKIKQLKSDIFISKLR